MLLGIYEKEKGKFALILFLMSVFVFQVHDVLLVWRPILSVDFCCRRAVKRRTRPQIKAKDLAIHARIIIITIMYFNEPITN